MLTDKEKQELLDDFIDWTGGDLPESFQQVKEYFETSCPFNYSTERSDEAFAYLLSEVWDATTGGRRYDL